MAGAKLVKLNKIYTRTGDAGTTGLVDGSRVSKADPRIAAVGDVDEANSLIGLAFGALGCNPVAVELERLQNELFDLGADLATPFGTDFEDGALRITPDQVERLERAIDEMTASLEPLRSFILPAGGAGAAELFLARAVVRRAERSAVAAIEQGAGLSPTALAYLNRLSDYLFVLARFQAVHHGGGEVLWQPGATRGS